MDIGRAVKVCRAAKRWQQRDLAEKVGLSPSYVSLIESGRREPPLSVLREIASALGIPIDLLLLLSLEEGDTSKARPEEVHALARELLHLVVTERATEA